MACPGGGLPTPKASSLNLYLSVWSLSSDFVYLMCVCVCVCVQSVFALQSAEQVDKISASLGAYDTLPDQSGTKQYTLESYSFEHFR